MPHNDYVDWNDLETQTQRHARDVNRALNEAERYYDRVLNFAAGRTDAQIATALGGAVTEAQVADLRQAAIALHQLYQCLNNVAVSQDDRYDKLLTFE